MTNRIILTPLLILSFLFAGCHSYTHHRPVANTIDARSEAQICIADCRESTDDDSSYYACLQACPGLVQEEGRCEDSSHQVCEEEKHISAGKSFVAVVGTGAAVLVTTVVVAVAAVGPHIPTCEGVAHC